MTYRISFRVARSAPQKQESGYESTGSDSLLFQAHCAAPGIAADSGSLFRRPPLDGRIQNYDSPYHVLSTNVKTEVCSPSMRSATPHGQCGIPVPSLDPSGRTARRSRAVNCHRRFRIPAAIVKVKCRLRANRNGILRKPRRQSGLHWDRVLAGRILRSRADA